MLRWPLTPVQVPMLSTCDCLNLTNTSTLASSIICLGQGLSISRSLQCYFTAEHPAVVSHSSRNQPPPLAPDYPQTSSSPRHSLLLSVLSLDFLFLEHQTPSHTRIWFHILLFFLEEMLSSDPHMDIFSFIGDKIYKFISVSMSLKTSLLYHQKSNCLVCFKFFWTCSGLSWDSYRC